MPWRIINVFGAMLVVLGFIGFAAPSLMGMHLSVVHNVIHLVTGFLTLAFGLVVNPSATRIFCTVLGVAYGLLGILGFTLAGPDGVWTVLPDRLVFGTVDHVMHLISGEVFFFGSFRSKRRGPSKAGAIQLRALAEPAFPMKLAYERIQSNRCGTHTGGNREGGLCAL